MPSISSPLAAVGDGGNVLITENSELAQPGSVFFGGLNPFSSGDNPFASLPLVHGLNTKNEAGRVAPPTQAAPEASPWRGAWIEGGLHERLQLRPSVSVSTADGPAPFVPLRAA